MQTILPIFRDFPHNSSDFPILRMKSLFTYSVSNTPWLIVVTNGGGHYYFNRESGTSVWQLSETDITDLSLRIDFDELAILFGKANGYVLPQTEKDVSIFKKRNTISETPVNSVNSAGVTSMDHPEPIVADEVNEVEDDTEFNKDTVVNEDAEVIEVNEVNKDTIYKESIEKLIDSVDKPILMSLNLGYSSDSEDSDDDEKELEKKIIEQNSDNDNGKDLVRKEGEIEHEVKNGNENFNQLDSENENENELENENVNAGLDLGFSSDDDNVPSDNETGNVTSSNEKFFQLLDENAQDIDIYDPWFLVEEELLPKLITQPEYYGVAEGSREELYNQWVEMRQTRKASNLDCGDQIPSSGTEKHLSPDQPVEENVEQSCSSKYPSSTQLFYQYLQTYKSEVKKCYYGEFLRGHHKELETLISEHGISDPEQLYRKLRVTLNDFAKHEKELKKNKSNPGIGGTQSNGNAKVDHVVSFLASSKILIVPQKTLELNQQTPLFEQWVQICNFYDVPSRVANSATNFILGDDKRLNCYKNLFGLVE